MTNVPSSFPGPAKLLIWAVAPTSLLLGLAAWSVSPPFQDALVRFTNSMLTSFTLFSLMLLLTLLVYGDRRKRPVAPFFGMVLSVAAGSALTYFFLSQGDLLMEDNGSVRAQALSNIIRFATTLVAMLVSVMVVAGSLFSSLMSAPPAPVVFEEE
jgi:cytochrome bd-type quinol oxidase subunit 2